MKIGVKSRRDIAAKLAFICTALLIQHLILVYMYHGRHVEALLCGEKDLSKALVIIAFVGIRFGTLVLLPGLVFYWVVAALARWLAASGLEFPLKTLIARIFEQS
jgi:hypothetical protein